MSPSPVLDRCPAVLRPHVAVDGLMVRIRIPGGRISAAALSGLGELAQDFGNPQIYLTSRCGVQLRGLPDPLPAEVPAIVAALGLLPSTSHEHARTIISSPLTGISGGISDVSTMITELDAAIMAAPELAQLSGRFLFVLDDGRGDVIDQAFDLGYVASSPDRGWVLVGDRTHGLPVRQRDAVPTMINLARSFVTRRPDPGVWHIRDLPAWSAEVAGLVEPVACSNVELPLGSVAGAASVLVPLSAADPQQLAAVTDVTDEVRLTPERGLVLPGAAASVDDLVAAGLVADRSSAWSMITACVGAPFCARTQSDTRAWARRLVQDGPVRGRTHLSGCERRCGAPRRDHLDLVGVPSNP